MALELVGGAVLGIVFDQFRSEIWRVKDNVVMFKPKLEELEETLEVLYPVIEEIEELNRRLNRPNHGRETVLLRRLLEDGTKLVSKCSKIPRWDIFKQSRYREKLMELDNKILRFHNLYMQAHMGRDQKQTLLFVQETRQMLIMSLNQQGYSNLTMGITVSSTSESSDPTMGLTASSTGSPHKQMIVMKVHLNCEKRIWKALTVVAQNNGVISMKIDRGENERLEVIGYGVDVVYLINHLRKQVGHADILTISDVK